MKSNFSEITPLVCGAELPRNPRGKMSFVFLIVHATPCSTLATRLRGRAEMASSIRARFRALPQTAASIGE